MAQFNNVSQLNLWLKEQIAASMNDVGTMVVEMVKDHIDTDVYSFSPSVYQRTYELQDSIVHSAPVISDDTVIISVYSDSNEIHPSSPNQHMSAITGVANPYVAVTVERGTSGHIFGEGYWTNPRPFMENAHDELQSSEMIKDVLKMSMSKKGINVI